MANLNFGKELKTSDDYIQELYELMGFKFPISINVLNGRVVSFSFDTEWKEGGTNPKEIEVIDDDGNVRTEIEYVEDYKHLKMTDEQVDKLKKWAAQNVAS